MEFTNLAFRDPRTVARDMPGVLDVLFPRLNGGLVASLNRKIFAVDGVEPVPDELIENSNIQKAMVFELSMVRAESLLSGDGEPSWDDCLQLASKRQRRHYDAKIPDKLEQCDLEIATRAAQNLVAIINFVRGMYPGVEIEKFPFVPGLGWISSGNGDFSLGPLLIEVKNTERNFGSGDFRQVLMYWLLKYSEAIEKNTEVWSDICLVNPRRNATLMVNFNYLIRSASVGSSRVELFELLRSLVGQDFDRR